MRGIVPSRREGIDRCATPGQPGFVNLLGFERLAHIHRDPETGVQDSACVRSQCLGPERRGELCERIINRRLRWRRVEKFDYESFPRSGWGGFRVD